MCPTLFWVLLVSFIHLSHHFEIDKYFGERLKVLNNHTFLVRSETESDALDRFSSFLGCQGNLTQYHDDSFCTLPSFILESSSDACECLVDRCAVSDNDVTYDDRLLYPGCKCAPRTLPRKFENSTEWRMSTNDTNMPFREFALKGVQTIATFIQSGSDTHDFDNSVATITSQIFRQSGLECRLRFFHHFSPQSLESTISVRAHFEDGKKEQFEIWRYERAYFLRTQLLWVEESIAIGSFSRPFRISVNCESGSPPTAEFLDKLKQGERKHFACSLASVYFSDCADIGDPSESCGRDSQVICQNSGNVKCLGDAYCDLNVDCNDGSDERNCGQTAVRGTMCDFNSESEFCDGWEQYTNVTKEAAPTNFEQLDDAKYDKSPKKSKSSSIYLFKNRVPGRKYELKSERKRGTRGVLSYEPAQIPKSDAAAIRMSALVSPVFPPTNPDAYNETNRAFESCKIRFWINTKFLDFKWQIAVISRTNDPFLSGKRILMDAQRFAWEYQQDEWIREAILIPRQNSPFRIAIFVDYNRHSQGFFALDDLTISPTCFTADADISLSTPPPPIISISTCNATGSTPPNSCDAVRDLDGQNSVYLKEDGTQDWTVDTTAFYRVEACGGAGGGLYGVPGQCAILQVHLRQDVVLRMLVGHHGEMACRRRAEQYSCRYWNGKRTAKTGGGGGGATLIGVRENTHDNDDDVWKVIIGGGAGQTYPMFLNDTSTITAGYGASQHLPKYGTSCKTLCMLTTPEQFFSYSSQRTCPEKSYVTILGGFGGGASTCGPIGGGGGGYVGGNPLGVTEQERSGSNHIDPLFSRDTVYYQNGRLENGRIQFRQCRRQCDLPSICRFGGDKLDEEYCACPDGSEYNNRSDSCTCTLYCPYSATCQFRNFTMQQFCQCSNGKEQFGTGFLECGEVSLPRLFAACLIVSILLVTFIACLFVRYFKIRNEKMAKEMIEFSLLKTNEYLYDDVYFGKLTRQTALEKLPAINRDELKIGRVLGKGNFGEVLFGKYYDMDVAVKTISKPFSACISAQSDFCNEALCMGTFIHHNIVRLIGIDFENSPFIIASEFMEGGDLLSFVKESRPSMVNLNPFHMTMTDLVRIVADVAAGCECLEEYGYVHRDIAARNILLTTKRSSRVAKIADFGMAKEMRVGSEYYRVHGRAMLPIKWTPPEAFVDGLFTTKSDVWSFGILCWEVFSLGVVPYPSRKNEEVMLMLSEGGRLEYPFGIPMRIYQLMRECWKTEPADRPNFSQITETIEQIASDPAVTSMSFPIHPAVRASYAHSQNSSSISCDTPQTTVTEVSMNSVFMDAAMKISPTQQDLNDMIKLHELMLIQEQPYTSEMAELFVDGLRKELARTTAQNNIFHFNTQLAQLFSPISSEDDETAKMISTNNVVSDQTPPSSIIDLNKLAVQNTGPTLHRPSSLNFQDGFSEPLLAVNNNEYSC